MLGPAESPGLGKGARVEQEQMELGGGSRRAVIEKGVKALGAKGRQCEEDTLAGSRFDSPLQIATRRAISAGHPRLTCASGEAVAGEGHEATATVLLPPSPPLVISALVGRRSVAQEMGREGLRKVRDRRRLFCGCERRGALGSARPL
jgi:hypothetical protein